MLDNIRGEVTYILRDIKTEEIISEHKQENIITEIFYTKLLNTWQFGFNVVVTSALMESSRFTHVFPGNGIASVTTSFPSRIIPSLGVYTLYVAPSGLVDAYVQIAGRYDAPTLGTSRTINSVGLGARSGTFYSAPTTAPDTDTGSYLNYNSGTAENVMAFLKLTSPCIQTDQQVLDVYYRLFFPASLSINNIPPSLYTARFVNADWTSSNYSSFPTGSRKSVFRFPKPKAGDEGYYILTNKGQTSGDSTSSYYWNLNTQSTTNTNLLGVRTATFTDAAFVDQAGQIINSMYWVTNTPTYWSKFISTNKIQNIFGTGTETTNPASPSFLDVDNLAGGTGKVFTGGTWNNIELPLSPGLYYSAKLPEYTRIKITTSGAIGVAEYKLIRQKFFGYLPKTTSANSSYYRYTDHTIIPLCQATTSTNGATRYETNNTLIEDVSETFFSTPQISACCRFDDSSFIFVKKNKIILYNIAAGDYWKYNGSYTNIHQVAVMNNKIYLACRNTGLWQIDPYNLLSPVSLALPGDGSIDLSVCHGVAKGYGNTIWAVANNCLAKFDGTTWTKYDSTTTPAFTMTGVSDNNWGNIEYIKVDEDSVDNQMLLVRKYNATSNPTLLGVWWSTAGVASNTGAETTPTSGNSGRPRVHRGHVGGLGGYWIVLVQNQWRSMTFGGSTFTTMTNVSAFPTGGGNFNNYNIGMMPLLFQSAIFVKTPAGAIRSWHVDGVNYFTLDGSARFSYTYEQNIVVVLPQKTVNNSNTVIESYTTTTTGLSLLWWQLTNEDAPWYNWGNTANGYWTCVKSATFSGYSGSYDMSHNFVLCPGVMVSINHDTYNGSYGNTIGVNTKVFNFGLDYTQSGGSMNYACLQEYGWDGSQWVLNNPNGKPTHTNAQNLFDGVSIRFEEGAAGTSFVSGNFYKFGLCEGILKDNATRATYSATPYYFRKVTTGVTSLETSVVPSAISGATGIVGIDSINKSANVSQNANNETLFPGQNVRQYAVGNKPLVGDFVLSIDVTNLNATDVKNAACVGVTRRDYVNTGMQYFGFICSAGTLYWYDNGSTGSIATITAGTTTSLEIRRVGATLTLWRNGSSVRTMTAATGVGPRTADYVLDVIFGVWDHRDCTYLPATGTRVPKATITSNGSAIFVNLGNSATNTGCFSSRFYGVDFITTGASTIIMDGVAVTPKIDGTAPAAGQITIDTLRGVMYFNSADIGKSLTASYTHLNS